MKPRTIIGVIFVVASLLKLACMWGLIHWTLLERISEDPIETYSGVFIILFVGAYLIYESFAKHSEEWEKNIVKTRTIIGALFVVGSLLKLASLWGIIRLSWLESMGDSAFETYFAVIIILLIGVGFILSGTKQEKLE